MAGVLVLACLAASGCASLTNPVAAGLPVRAAPPELIDSNRNREETIPLALLQHPPSGAYRLDAGDVLGIWIEGITGDKTIPLPVNTPLGAATGAATVRAGNPATGYPFTIDDDGTLALPLIPPVPVRGLTVPQAREAVRAAYVKREVLVAGRERVLLSLLQPRRIEVVVMRQEAASFGTTGGGTAVIGGAFAPTGKRGVGQVLELPAYSNDVLHALAWSGGLPGLDACNEVVVFRRAAPAPARPELLKRLAELPPGARSAAALLGGCPVVRIPLRCEPGQPLPFRVEDVILQQGDVVFLEARDRDVFYTGGLLPAGEHVLPRDRDLDVVEAVALVRGPLVNGNFNTNNLSGALVQPGVGNPNPSLLTVLRRTPGGGQVPIRVDLNLAMADPRERIAVKPGDLLILQETPGESLTRYLTQTLANIDLSWTPWRSRSGTLLFDFMAPDRQLGRPGVITNSLTTTNGALGSNVVPVPR